MKKFLLVLIILVSLTGCYSNQTNVSEHLYKIQSHDGYTVYILGTNHQSQKIEKLDDISEEIIEECDTLYTEIPMDIDMIQQVQKKYMNVNPAKEVLNHQQLKRLEKIKDQYHSFQLIDYQNIQLMYLSSMCNQEILSSLGYTSLGIDSYLYDHFKGKKKSLETIEFQCQLLTELSKNSSEMILQSIENKKESEKYCKELFEIYYQGTREEMNSFATNVYKQNQKDKNARYYYQDLIVKRNDHMIEKIEKMFDDEDIELVAVGVLHVAGEYGIISELKNRGYIVEEVH